MQTVPMQAGSLASWSATRLPKHVPTLTNRSTPSASRTFVTAAREDAVSRATSAAVQEETTPGLSPTPA